MSVQAMSKVFDIQGLPSSQKFVLLSLANRCDQYGGSCYPSVATVCAETSLGESTVRAILKELENAGWIVCVKGASQHRPKTWQLNVGLPRASKTEPSITPQTLKMQVIEVFQQTCEYCHREGTDDRGPDGNAWEVDRIVPASRNGKYEPANVALACRSCNSSKGVREAPQGTRSLADILRAPESGTLEFPQRISRPPESDTLVSTRPPDYSTPDLQISAPRAPESGPNPLEPSHRTVTGKEEERANERTPVIISMSKQRIPVEDLAAVLGLFREYVPGVDPRAAEQLVTRCRQHGPIPAEEICTLLKGALDRMPSHVENPVGWILRVVPARIDTHCNRALSLNRDLAPPPEAGALPSAHDASIRVTKGISVQQPSRVAHEPAVRKDIGTSNDEYANAFRSRLRTM